MSLTHTLKLLVANGINLVRKSYLRCRVPAKFVGEGKEWIFTWAVTDRDDVESCVYRYFGRVYAQWVKEKEVFACVLCTFPPSKEFLDRMVAQGALVFYDSPLTIRSLLEMLREGWALRTSAVLDAEYWRGFWISKLVLNFIVDLKIKTLNIRLPYEQQPWQLHLIKSLRAHLAEKVAIVGDVHSSMTSLPLQFGRMGIGPDLLVVHGQAYHRVLTSLLGWPAGAVTIEPTRRFTKKLELFKNTIFLPYDFSSAAAVIQELRGILTRSECLDGLFDIRIHPARSVEPSHLKLASLLRQMVDELAPNGGGSPRSKEPVAIVIGVSTTLLEALEAGYNAVGVYEYPEYEVYSPEIWPEVGIQWLSDHAVQYCLKTPGAFILYE